MKKRVALLYGGRSGEHEVSLRSAASVAKAIPESKYEVLHYVIDKQGKWSPKPILPEPGANPEIDVVFPLLHGTFGEDGTVQGLLELAGLPYVGPGVFASSACMDKEYQKRLCRERGLPVVDYLTVFRDNINIERICGRFDFPVFIKPANMGSSVGITKAKNCQQLRDGLLTAAQYDFKILVERGIDAQEVECSVVGNRQPFASTPCEVLPSREFYDYEDKYLLDKAKFRIPADLTKEEIAEVRRLAVEAFKATACEGMARVDFLIEKSSGQIYINEVNTIPGFTSISMFPKMLEHDGIGFSELVDRLIQWGIDRHARHQRTRFER